MVHKYVYKVVREDFCTDRRAKRCRKITQYEPLRIGGLYCHLGKGYPGCYRVLELVEKTVEEDS